MPRYHYHIRAGSSLHLDADGRECPDLHEAVLQAYVSVLKAFDGLVPLESLLNVAIEVTDETGMPLFALPFSSVVGHWSEAEAPVACPRPMPRLRAA